MGWKEEVWAQKAHVLPFPRDHPNCCWKIFETVIFWPFQIYTSLFRKNCQKKFGMAFLAILNLYQSFWEKLSEKIWNSHFWPFQICTSLFGKIVRKNSECPFLAIPNLYQSFWDKLSEKIWNSHF